MEAAKSFATFCKKAIADYEGGKTPLIEDVAAKICSYGLDSGVHPMLHKVHDLAFDIDEDYRSPEDNEADWDMLVGTLRAYDSAHWEPTCWILSATYGKYSGDKLVQSFSVAINRQNGKTTIETALEDLEKAIKSVLPKVNERQTDERYLQNLNLVIPSITGTYKLASVEVKEYLTEPYYSTAA